MAKKRKKQKKNKFKYIIFLLLIIIFLLIGYFFINYLIIINTQDKEVNISNYYVYGNHFNIEGSIKINNSDNEKAYLVLKNFITEKEIKIKTEKSKNNLYFYLSDKINKGIDLEKLSLGRWYLLLKIKGNDTKYYNLNNITNYENLKYYTISNNNFNKKINILFNHRYKKNYVVLDIVPTILPKNVYDITIDPGHGGKDIGSSTLLEGNQYNESELSLNVALSLKKRLEEDGFKVLITRKKNNLDYYGNKGRAVLPNKYKTKFCFSIHLNSEEIKNNQKGLEIYVPNDIDVKLAQAIAQNIVNKTNISYSKKIGNKLSNGIYYNYYTEQDIIDDYKESIENGFDPYEIEVGAPEMYMIREVGGKATKAFVDGRIKEYGLNPYYNSNQTAESYLLELGYISNENDLKEIINNYDSIAKSIENAIKEYLK